jgi:MoaA/NifB/PqqE/SkfB family radical SAM enzyme
VTSEDTLKKAKLLEIGEIFIPKEIDMPCFASRSTAGPDAGFGSHAFEFGAARVKLGVTKDQGARLRLKQIDGSFSIYLDGDRYIGQARILPLAAHAPNQAFVNLSGECRMGCAFCSMPAPSGKPQPSLSAERAMRIISISSRQKEFEAVAMTSGIPESVSRTNGEMLELVREVRRQFARIPIGVETYIEDPGDILKFRHAGATEMKINVEAWPEERFGKVCPNRDFGSTIAALEKAVEIFGRGKVTSNILAGLGETDDEIIEALNHLAGMGVIPNVRGIRIGAANAPKLEKALGFVPERVKAERLLALGKEHRRILEMNGLDASKFDTMCFSCKCCDIVPMIDV